MLERRVYGKALGAVVGIIVGLLLSSGTLAIVFACMGTVIGHFLFDQRDEPKPTEAQLKSIDELLAEERVAAPAVRTLARTSPDAEMARLLCPIFVEVARVDGPVTREEVRVTREYFRDGRQFAEESLEHVRLSLKDALGAKPAELADLTRKARAKLAPPERPSLVNALYALALVDGALKRAESDAIKQVVQALNMTEAQLQQITTMYLGSGAEHYRALGLTEAASDDEIRSAFRRLAAEHHPDRAKGDAAAARFREVNDAYQGLRKLRGL
jgi:DnaJ like chaperone protein